MNKKSFSLFLVILNSTLIICLLISTNLNSKKKTSVNLLRTNNYKTKKYLFLCQKYSNFFEDLEVQDSLIGSYMLFIPTQGCGACIDSSLSIMNGLCSEINEIKLFISSSTENEYLFRYLRYNNIDFPVYYCNKMNTFETKVDFPLLSFYKNKGNFVSTLPITKEMPDLVRSSIVRSFNQNTPILSSQHSK